MSNFKKRLIVSLLAFPLIYILLYQKVLSNLLIIIVFLFCIFEWVKIFKKKNAIFFLGLIVLFAFEPLGITMIQLFIEIIELIALVMESAAFPNATV